MKSLPKGLSALVKIFGIIIAVGFLCLLLVIVVLSISYAIPPEHTIITDISDYGVFTGNRRNDYVEELITSFFPEEITEDFSDVIYSYHAIKESTYTFEAYLEFTIEDSEAFFEQIAAIAPENEWNKFEYDDKFREYNYTNGLELIQMYQEPKTCFEWAEICKVLYSEEDHRVIYVAIGVDNDSFVEVSELSVFFERFQVDPEEYEKTATPFWNQ